MADDLTETIKTAAAEPQSATVDGVSVSQRPLKDLIDADKHLAGKAAAGRKTVPIRFAKMVPPGAV